jgi:phosphoglycolate phosphatase
VSDSRRSAPHVLFDLDGTLVDSAPAILAAFRLVLDRNGIRAEVPLDSRLIGAPLMPTLLRLTGAAREEDVARLADLFRDVYDGEGLAATVAYDGLAEVLENLVDRGHRLYVVTNKRDVPTRRILALLRIAHRFAGVHALDAAVPSVRDKRGLVAQVLGVHGLRAADCVMVGDTVEDATAAWANGLPFVGATYGYGTPTVGAPAAPLATIANLRELPARLDELATPLPPLPGP